MNEVPIKMSFKSQRPGGTKGYCAVTSGDKVLHGDSIDIAKEQNRRQFVDELTGRYPGVNRDDVSQWLLDQAHQIAAADVGDAPEPTELDIRRIVRPHLFHLPQVSGLLTPVTQAHGSKIFGKWLLCLQWEDGRRQCIDLPDYLETADGQRIWFSKIPPAPSATTVSPWSLRGRTQWLAGHVPDIRNLFDRVYTQIGDYLEFPEEDAFAMAATLSLWTMLTYAYPVWSAVPYLSVGGPLGSGKSRLFEVLGFLVNAPLHSSNMTAACLFRTLDNTGGTLLLDEAERLNDNTPDAGEIRGILLAGYKRSGQASRLEKVDDRFVMVSFNVYSCKAVAAISSMPPALASRCIPIMMFRAAKDSPVPRHRLDPEAPVWRELRDDLHAMALAHGASFVRLVDWLPACADLNGRSLELWLPILAIAKLVEDAGLMGLVESVQAFAVKSSKSTQEDVVPEVDDILLRRLHRMLQDKSWGATAGELLETVKEEEPTLFARYTPKGVGTILNRYGIRAKRTGGKRLFLVADVQWQRIVRSYGIVFDETAEPHGSQ